MVVQEETYRREYQNTEQEAHSCPRTILYRLTKGDAIAMTEHGKVKSGENDDIDTSDSLQFESVSLPHGGDGLR